MVFDAIDQPGVLAVTFVWGTFGGPPGGRVLVEWDQVYDDDGDVVWADLPDGPAGAFDFFNVAIHEVGHAFGLDHPDATCTEQTMYAYAAAGEMKKRTLEAGDVAGITELYR